MRSFNKELRIFRGKHVTKELVKDIIYRIEKTLRDEDSTIQKVSVYSIHNPQPPNITLYFVISSVDYPADRHMRFPLLDNPDFTAHFLNETEQMTQAQLDEYQLVDYQFPA